MKVTYQVLVRKYKFTFFSLLVLTLLITLSGCGDLGYYLQCASGQFELIQRATPIATLLDDPHLDPAIRSRLKRAQEIRNFASRELLLPDNDSYRSYADIERPYVVWNVVASDEFSLQPQQWCFPIAGCVSYRGYFKQTDAEALGTALQADSKDVDVYGVQAYSTLNWFSDPLLNTFINSAETRLAGLIFHELAHQLIYVKGDSSFNEAFAQAIQQEGVKRWLQQEQDQQTWDAYQQGLKQQRIFHQLLFNTRNQLQALYDQPSLQNIERRRKKQLILEAAQARFADLRDAGILDKRFDRWMARGLNNARLASLATYYDLLPGLQRLIASCPDLNSFYQQVEILSQKPKKQRHLALLPP